MKRISTDAPDLAAGPAVGPGRDGVRRERPGFRPGHDLRLGLSAGLRQPGGRIQDLRQCLPGQARRLHAGRPVGMRRRELRFPASAASSMRRSAANGTASAANSAMPARRAPRISPWCATAAADGIGERCARSADEGQRRRLRDKSQLYQRHVFKPAARASASSRAPHPPLGTFSRGTGRRKGGLCNRCATLPFVAVMMLVRDRKRDAAGGTGDWLMNIPALVAARIAALVFAAAALLSACTVDVEQPRPEPPYGPQSGYCTREYAPVCARRGGDRQTFNNGCLAEEAGYRILRSGECRNRGDDYGDGGGSYERRRWRRRWRRHRQGMLRGSRPGLRQARQRPAHLRQ